MVGGQSGRFLRTIICFIITRDWVNDGCERFVRPIHRHSLPFISWINLLFQFSNRSVRLYEPQEGTSKT